MNWKAVNLEICRSLANDGDIVRGQLLSDKKELFLVIPADGYYGYFIPHKLIVFSLSKIKMLSKRVADLSIIRPENCIQKTDYLRDMGRVKGVKMYARKFITAAGENVWVNEKLMKNLCDDAQGSYWFYQKPGDLYSLIFVVQNQEPVMCLLPLKIADEIFVHEENELSKWLHPDAVEIQHAKK